MRRHPEEDPVEICEKAGHDLSVPFCGNTVSGRINEDVRRQILRMLMNNFLPYFVFYHVYDPTGGPIFTQALFEL